MHIARHKHHDKNTNVGILVAVIAIVTIVLIIVFMIVGLT